MDTPTIAALIHENLELTEGKSCKSSGAKWVEVVGWKGNRDVDEIRGLDGTAVDIVADFRRTQDDLQRCCPLSP